MNLTRLKKAEQEFLAKYPGGFEHPAMVEILRKHKVDAMKQLASERFAKASFKDPDEIVASMIRTVTQSSLVSVFEKPRFRDVVKTLSPAERSVMVKGLKDQLHGNERRGFETLLDILAAYKLAKWTLITAVPAYYRPDQEVFIKPTTTKKIIAGLDLSLTYRATPSWEFYEAYREVINKMKKKVSKVLSPSNTAFCGFLMTTLE